jgi:hypothetical protein
MSTTLLSRSYAADLILLFDIQPGGCHRTLTVRAPAPLYRDAVVERDWFVEFLNAPEFLTAVSAIGNDEVLEPLGIV